MKEGVSDMAFSCFLDNGDNYVFASPVFTGRSNLNTRPR